MPDKPTRSLAKASALAACIAFAVPGAANGEPSASAKGGEAFSYTGVVYDHLNRDRPLLIGDPDHDKCGGLTVGVHWENFGALTPVPYPAQGLLVSVPGGWNAIVSASFIPTNRRFHSRELPATITAFPRAVTVVWGLAHRGRDRRLHHLRRAHEAGFRGVLTGAVTNRQMAAVIEQTRERDLDAFVAGVAATARSSARARRSNVLRAALHAHMHFMEGAIVRWLAHREITREQLRDLILRALEGSIAAGQAVDDTIASR